MTYRVSCGDRNFDVKNDDPCLKLSGHLHRMLNATQHVSYAASTHNKARHVFVSKLELFGYQSQQDSRVIIQTVLIVVVDT